LSRHQIIKKLKEKNPKLNQSETEEILEFFCQFIENALVDKRNIELRGFGSFLSTEIREKYSARNPKTGELIYVPKKNRVRFRASKNLKAFVNK
tara:strand:+ start:41 stop:322 length:282 start_codon:yes stop_codon:yes gene_type:complete